VQILLGCGNILHLLLFDQLMTPQTLFVLFETNARETVEFLHMYAGEAAMQALMLAFGPLFAVALGFWVWGKLGEENRVWGRRVYLAGVLLAMVVASFSIPLKHAWQATPLLQLTETLKRYRSETEIYYQMKAALGSHEEAQDLRPATDPEELFVLVIGESTSREHMSLYGYPRKTSPRLEALGEELFVYRDVVSPHSHTQRVLKELLTFHDREDPRLWNQAPTLIQTMHEAGYQTYWISNQEVYGLWSNLTTALGGQADIKIFHKNRKAGLVRRAHDGDLLPYLDRLLERPAERGRFLVLHLMGTHGWYPNRYPQKFARFQGTPPASRGRRMHPQMEATINFYDNAVLYNDWLVSEVIRRIEARGARSYVLYLSDHGEDVYDSGNFLGHTEEVGTRFMVEIPMVLWLSPAYRLRHPEMEGRVRRGLDWPFMTDDLIHCLMDLAYLRPADYRSTKSLFQADFQIDRGRIYAGRNYDQELAVSPP
jgi:heptose-I-phosphate ethanolaminephosphotransferase